MTRSPRFLASAALLVLALCQVVYAFAAAPVLGALAWPDPGRILPLGAARGIAVGGLVGCGALFLALVALAGAAGVATGQRWGWGLGIAASVLWIPSGCVPVALLALGILLHPAVRAELT